MRNFEDDFKRSKQDQHSRRWSEIFDRLGVYSTRSASAEEDRRGIDLFVCNRQGVEYKAELKVRYTDRDWGDFSLEQWSSVEDRKVGWTLDPSKESDLIFEDHPNQRVCYVLPFAPLRSWFAQYIEHAPFLKVHDEANKGYTTRNIRVSRQTVFNALPYHYEIRY